MDAECTDPIGRASQDGSVDLRSREERAYEEALSVFVDFWGDMASSWGINRTMAQLHALLYAVERPLDTDEIMARLGISRGNANMNLRTLVEWNLVDRIHLPGSRKDFFTAEKDVWKICMIVIQQRQQKEIGPVKDTLRECLVLLDQESGAGDGPPPANVRQFADRIQNLVDLMSVFEGFTRALLPFVRERNVTMIKRLISFAQRRAASNAGEA